MKVIINGAGVAGPTLAYWLLRFGHEPVLVEEAPRLRTGGYVIDFWGVGYDIAEKMGLIPRVRGFGYEIEEVRFVDSSGRRSGGFPAKIFSSMAGGRYTSLQRSDLAATIYGAIEGKVETIFGDSVAAIDEHPDGVAVAFDHGPPRRFDIAVGADGLHSRVRAIAFGPEDDFETHLGYDVAAFEIEGYRPRDELVYVSHALPGRQISRFSMRNDRTLFLFVSCDAERRAPLPATDEERRQTLRVRFGDMGWECPQILGAMERASGIYFDRVSQIRMGGWSKGRTVLVGDAAACVSLLAGEGTGLAMTEAYVLAGELARAEGDYTAAFTRYQDRLMSFLREKQKSAVGFASFFVPSSAFGIGFRNLATRAMGIPLVADFLMGRSLRDDIALPDYARHAAGRGAD
jgi:2-polyprenyl-6-methoxyphenol hydroxylase-like FAD-dependent oxidoreductase